MINPEHKDIIRKEKDPQVVRLTQGGYSYVGTTSQEGHPLLESRPRIVSKLFSAVEEVDQIEIIREKIKYEGDAKTFHRTKVRQLPKKESFANSRVGKLIKKIARK